MDWKPDEEELQMDDETFSQKDSKRIAKEHVMYRVGDDFEEIVNREDDIQLFPGVGKEAVRRHVRRSDSAEALHQAGFEDEFLGDEEIEIDLTQPWHLDEDNTEEAFSSPYAEDEDIRAQEPEREDKPAIKSAREDLLPWGAQHEKMEPVDRRSGQGCNYQGADS